MDILRCANDPCCRIAIIIYYMPPVMNIYIISVRLFKPVFIFPCTFISFRNNLFQPRQYPNPVIRVYAHFPETLRYKCIFNRITKDPFMPAVYPKYLPGQEIPFPKTIISYFSDKLIKLCQCSEPLLLAFRVFGIRVITAFKRHTQHIRIMPGGYIKPCPFFRPVFPEMNRGIRRKFFVINSVKFYRYRSCKLFPEIFANDISGRNIQYLLSRRVPVFYRPFAIYDKVSVG